MNSPNPSPFRVLLLIAASFLLGALLSSSLGAGSEQQQAPVTADVSK